MQDALHTAIQHHRAGQLPQAEALYRQILAATPDHPQALHYLGLLASQRGDHAAAVAFLARAAALAPSAESFNTLGAALRDGQRLQDAISAFQQAVALKPYFAEAQFNLGSALQQAGRIDEALAAYRAAATLDPMDAVAHFNVGSTLVLKSDLLGAQAAFRRAAELQPGSAFFWNGLGAALNCLGRFDEASQAFRRALQIAPEARFYRGLASAGHHAVESQDVVRLNGLLYDPALPLGERVTAGFILGKLMDDQGRYDEAFALFAAANRLHRDSRAAAGQRFDRVAIQRTVDERVAWFTPGFFAARHDWGRYSDGPVFIVGMPRSGTSLVEQIAASHPAVFGAGELPAVGNIPFVLAPAESLQRDAVEAAAAGYLDHVHSIARPGTTRIIDKMPGNIFHLGLIALMFPGARVILCRREPRDNCLSCFFQQFDDDGMLFACDLEDCAWQYLQTGRLAAHWRAALPLRILEVQYESLVAGQERESRRLIEFLGLPWHDNCLNFHRTQRTVMTASLWQVRQPIYSRSVGRWRHYQRHLPPLLEALGIR